MRDRAALVAAVLVLFGGMSVWALVAERGEPSLASVRLRPPAPQIGEPIAADAAVAAPDRAVLASAMLGGLPLVRVLTRASVPVHAIVVPGRDAIAARDRMRAVAGAERVPVVVGDGWSTRAHADAAATTGDSPEAIVRRAAALDVDAWLAPRIASLAPASQPSTPEGARVVPGERWSIVRDSQIDAWLPEVAIALLPASDPAFAPAWLAFGNWEGCPDPTVHVAMLMRWRDGFGAEVVAIGEDAIELRVARPPSDAEAALAIAREHAAYAPSLLAGERSVEALAGELLGAPSWTFRWPRRATTH